MLINNGLQRGMIHADSYPKRGLTKGKEAHSQLNVKSTQFSEHTNKSSLNET